MDTAHRNLVLVIFLVALAFASGVLFSAYIIGKDQHCVSAPVNGVVATWCAKELPPVTEF